MSATEATQFLKRLEKAGVELFLWKGTVRFEPKVKLGKVSAAEFEKLCHEIKNILARRADLDRTQPGLQHKWLLKRGYYDALTEKFVPGYLACGPVAWCQHCIRAARIFSSSPEEKALWVVLEPEQVGIIERNEKGILVATSVTLPEGRGQATPEGLSVEVADACQACLTPPGPKLEDDNSGTATT